MVSPQPVGVEETLERGVGEAHEGGRRRPHGQPAQEIALPLRQLRGIRVVGAARGEGRSALVGIMGGIDARGVGLRGRMWGGRSRCSAGQTGIAEYGVLARAPVEESVAEVRRGAGAADLARPSAVITLLLGASVGQSTFGDTRPVHLALRDPHGDLGGSVLVAAGGPKAHRRPWAWGPVCSVAHGRGILAARVCLVLRREKIVAGGAVLLRRERGVQVAPLRRSDAVSEGARTGPVPNGTDGCSPSEVNGGR